MGHALAIMTSGTLLVPENRNTQIVAGPYRIAFTLPGGTGHFLSAATLIPVAVPTFDTVVQTEGGVEGMPRASIIALAEALDGGVVRLTYSVYEILTLDGPADAAIAAADPAGGGSRG